MKNSSSGFSTVELVVTLFVATMFIISGYQLFGVITASSGASRQLSLASNIGYDVLRSRGGINIASYTNQCSSSVSVENVEVDTTGLPSATVKIERCRPYSSPDLGIVKVTSIVEYGTSTPKKRVSHATYFSQ